MQTIPFDHSFLQRPFFSLVAMTFGGRVGRVAGRS